MTERSYLRDVQYRDDSNLNARVELHQRFGTRAGVFNHMVFDQLSLPADARVLEVGCGPGRLWAENAERVPPGWRVVLTDFSRGMVEVARRRLGARFGFAVSDAEALAHPAGAFDAAIANHMLYHVADRPRAIRELARVLRPDGVLYAVTNGRAHLRELDELMARWLPGGPGFLHGAAFGLENGAAQLAEGFAHVELRRWDDALEITEVEPVVAYARSIAVDGRVDDEAVRRTVAGLIERHGAFHVGRAAGMFVATSPIQSRT